MAPVAGKTNFFVFTEAESLSEISRHGSNWYTSHQGIEDTIRVIHNAYPVVLLLMFMVSLVVHGIRNAESAEPTANAYTKPKATGPGGKPLPTTIVSTKAKKPEATRLTLVRRFLFAWLSVGLIATFLGNAANILVHALSARKDGYWCGSSGVVSDLLQYINTCLMLLPRSTL